MNGVTTGLVAAAALLPIAFGCVRWLRHGSYRRPTEADHEPRRLGWLLAALPFAAFLLARAVTDSHADRLGAWSAATLGLAYCAALPLLAVLAAIDMDVHRLPDRWTIRLLPAAFAVALLRAALTGDWWVLLWALLIGVGAGALYLLMFIASGGGIGLGDVKLAVGLGVLTGALSWTVTLSAVLIGFVLAGVWAVLLLASRRATRHTHIAFGPFMIAGSLLALVGS